MNFQFSSKSPFMTHVTCQPMIGVNKKENDICQLMIGDMRPKYLNRYIG